MTERFGEAAVRAAGHAALLLGWRPAEFWAATPAELAAVLKAFAPSAPDSPVGTDILKQLMELDPDGR